MTPEEALARECIRQTQNAYHAKAERGRAAEVAELFTEDGTLEFSAETFHGRAAIAAALGGVGAKVPAAPFFLRHHLTTSHVEFVSEDEAKGWSYFLVISPIGLDHAGRYIDTYVNDNDRWLFASRRVSIDWMSDDSVV